MTSRTKEAIRGTSIGVERLALALTQSWPPKALASVFRGNWARLAFE
jgi:hypothetical protein